MAGNADAPVTPKDVWDELEAQGASAVKAAGIMGNWIAESRLNPEAHAMDSNGYVSYGLAQWNSAPGNYPSAPTLVTGHPAHDLKQQVRFFFQTGGGQAASGSTPQQVAASVAANYERCQGCASGGGQNTARQANAATVAGWASAGSWPASTGGASDTATLTSAGQAQSQSECMVALPSWHVDIFFGHGPTVGGGCLLPKSTGRALEAAGLMLAGGVVLGAGLALALVASALGGTKVARAVQSVPGSGRVASAAAGAAQGGDDDAQARRDLAHERHTANQYRKQRRARENYERDAEREDEAVPF